eukprot:TRINITY_DN33359_c0_g1_i1.p1 TRINITY_DN33359_c0_g1~~TRINITY_DN33359_c0_g1_i1.p1  ORF type:complete len:311 (+),score=54.76 TRINITY_DN33359_c0_g1_i1:27-935(+)
MSSKKAFAKGNRIPRYHHHARVLIAAVAGVGVAKVLGYSLASVSCFTSLSTIRGGLCSTRSPESCLRASAPAQVVRRLACKELQVEVIDDLISNGTAYALAPGAVPMESPEDNVIKYDIDTFSPGFVVDNVLSKTTCDKLVSLCEEIGFKKRWGTLGVITLFLDEAFERTIFKRIEHLLPNQMGGKPKGIQRRWAVVKYEPGQYMNPHIDGHVPDAMRVGDAIQHAPGTRSYMTALFWLADDVEGGETVFTFPQGGTWVKIPPKTGAALFFNHGQNAVSNPLHHGGSVKAGIKYLVRADVIY